MRAAAEAAAHARAAKLMEIAAVKAREAEEPDELDDAARREAAMHAWQAAEYESRPRWEDYRIPGTNKWSDTPDTSRRPDNQPMRD